MNCPKCNGLIADGAVVCKHCKAILGTPKRPLGVAILGWFTLFTAAIAAWNAINPQPQFTYIWGIHVGIVTYQFISAVQAALSTYCGVGLLVQDYWARKVTIVVQIVALPGGVLTFFAVPELRAHMNATAPWGYFGLLFGLGVGIWILYYLIRRRDYFPRSVQSAASGHSGGEVTGGRASARTTSRVSPPIVTAIGGAVVVAIFGGYLLYASMHAKRQMEERQRQVQENFERARQEARQRLEHEKRRRAEADAAARAAATAAMQPPVGSGFPPTEPQRPQEARPEPAAAAAPERTATPAPVSEVLTNQSLDNQLRKVQSTEIRELLFGSLKGDTSGIDRMVQVIEGREKPPKGNRKEARKLNAEGLEHFGAGRFAAAGLSFEQAMQVDPSDQEIVNNGGFAHLEAGNLMRAETLLVQALFLAPTRSSAWINLGLLYAKRGDDRLSVAAFQNGIRFTRNPSRAQTYFEKVLAEAEEPVRTALTEAMRNVPLSPTSAK